VEDKRDASKPGGVKEPEMASATVATEVGS
jgi:hypothetical protein